MMSPAYASTTSPTPTALTVDAWLQWFATEKRAACRAHLCTRYHLNALDAEALINTALLQVVRRWASLDNPLAYVWQTLKHAVAKQRQRCAYERQQLRTYTQQHQVHSHGAARTAVQVATVLGLVSLRQQQLLAWYVQGYSDAEVAGWLQTTPAAVRVARHSVYCALRAQLCPLAATAAATATPQEGKNFLGGA